MKKIINPRTGVLAAMILVAGAWRLLISGEYSPLTNFTPIGAMALFGGCYFTDKWKAYAVPLLTLWLSDLVLGYFIYYHKLVWFYDGFLWTYAGFALMVMMGAFIKKVNVKNVVLASVSAALVHLLISNFGVWLNRICITTGQPFTQDIQGLLLCYSLALPYMMNMLIGNLVFGGIMFGAFEWAQKRYPQLQLRTA